MIARALDSLSARTLLGVFIGLVLSVALLAPAGLAQDAGPEKEEAAADHEWNTAELDELVKPIALYPDKVIALILPASCYGLEVVEAARYLKKKGGKVDANPEKDWDPAVIGLLQFPDILKKMDEDLEWTQDLGDAVAAQQEEVMAAIQRQRAKAQAVGNLESDDKTTVTEDDGSILISPADPEVIYVYDYDPNVVYTHTYRRRYWGYYYRPWWGSWWGYYGTGWGSYSVTYHHHHRHGGGGNKWKPDPGKRPGRPGHLPARPGRPQRPGGGARPPSRPGRPGGTRPARPSIKHMCTTKTFTYYNRSRNS